MALVASNGSLLLG